MAKSGTKLIANNKKAFFDYFIDEKYECGIYLAGTEVIPTWVNMHTNQGKKEYNILPLIKENEERWKESYALTDHQFTSCQRSYDRTMGIVGEGLEACQTYLEQAKADREQYYYDLAFNPEKFVTEVPVETEAAEPATEETALPAASRKTSHGSACGNGGGGDHASRSII